MGVLLAVVIYTGIFLLGSWLFGSRPWTNALCAGIGWFLGSRILHATNARVVCQHIWLQLGRCTNCGYDTRATPQRCPECGAAVTAGK
jgi:hypothetical protein